MLTALLFGGRFCGRVDAGCVITTDVNTAAVTFELLSLSMLDRFVFGWESDNLALEVVFAKLNCVELFDAPRGCSDRPACEDIND